MNDRLPATDREQTLLREIGVLSDRLRAMRAAPALINSPEIKVLEAQSRAKWEELRTLRARPMNADLPAPNERGHYH